MKDQVEEILQTLAPRERRAPRLRFGLEDGRPRTLEEVGGEFRVTRERIRQIESKTLRKLHHIRLRFVATGMPAPEGQGHRL